MPNAPIPRRAAAPADVDVTSVDECFG